MIYKINTTASWWYAISNKKFYWLLGALSALAVIKIFINIYFPLDLHSEEAQYWVWSKRLQLSYYSKPPMIAYLNRISTSVLGNTVLGIRINGILIGFLVSIVNYLFAYELFKDINTAVATAVVTNIFPFLISISTYFSTDSPLILFWLCAMLFYWKAAETRKTLWWILFGISIGLGALSKYTIFLIFIPIVLFTWKHQREIFRSVNFYLSFFIGLLIFSPVIYWNIRQNGVGFQHIAYLTGLYDHHHSVWQVVSNMLEFTIGQIAFLLPFYQYHLIYRKYKEKTITKEEEYLIIPALCMFFIFLSVSAIRPAGAYINWAMFAYTGVPILLAHYALKEKSKKLNLRIFCSMLLGLLLLIGLTSP
jgi:4-amino-4-deoxy-L-arabinose transferase-like glycosyltransferase